MLAKAGFTLLLVLKRSGILTLLHGSTSGLSPGHNCLLHGCVLQPASLRQAQGSRCQGRRHP